MKTFLQLKTEIAAIMWPDGRPENLVSAHDIMFEEALVEIQTWVKCYQQFQVNTYPQCSTWFKCGLTVFDAPKGIVTRVFTVSKPASGDYDWCDVVFMNQREWPLPEKWSRNFLQYVAPGNVGFPKLPQGFLYANKDSDSPVGRARTGIWAHNRGRIYVAPWIQSNEMIVVEWRGPKQKWNDTDPVADDIEFRTCVKYYLQFAHERDFGANDEAGKFRTLFDSKLADLIWACNERTRVRRDLEYDDTRFRTLAEIQDDAVPNPEGMTFAVIGNYGANASGERNVSDLLRSWAPEFIVTAGNNSYNGDYDTDVGSYYHDFIYPYAGEHGAGAAANLFWPAIGQQDWDHNINAYKAFFRLPDNERYYELVRGDVHFFILNSVVDEPSGNGPSSTQAAWLAAKAALSTAAWKVVVIHHPPYSSGNAMGSQSSSQWNFASMGINLVISAGSSTYERLLVGGVNYVVNGLGGAPIEQFDTPVAGSLVRNNDDYGALKLDATPTTLKAEFWDRYSYLRDTLQLTK